MIRRSGSPLDRLREPGHGIDEVPMSLEADQPPQGDHDEGVVRNAMSSAQLGHPLRRHRMHRLGEVVDVMDPIRRQAVLDHPIAELLGVADPAVGMSKRPERVIAAEPGEMNRPFRRAEVRQPGGPSHVGLDDVRANPADGARDGIARERIPGREKRQAMDLQRSVVEIVETAAAADRQVDGRPAFGKRKAEADRPALGTAEGLAGDHLETGWI
jgi:hypothetical protein